MKLILVIAGGFLGMWLGGIGEEALGLFAGAIIGSLIAERRSLHRKVTALSDRVAQLHARGSSTEPIVKPDTQPEYDAEPSAPAQTTRQSPPAAPPFTQARPALDRAPAAKPAASLSPDTDGTPKKPASPTPGAIDNLIVVAKGWLTTGNVPVKLGVIVSFFGVAFLLKYAVEARVLTVPIELRYLGVAAGAVAMLGFGWRLRSRLRVYALSLQGGGIGVLYLTIFAAFRLHPLLPAAFAFLLLIALTIFAGVLAVRQNAAALAVLGIVGGFLAPILLSTGSGNHVALFTYYLLLNAAVLGIAWFRSWRFLNVIGFVFTFGVAAVWGHKYYHSALFASTEPFLVAWFLFYQGIAILFAFRQPPKLRGIVDGTLIFGTPVIAFLLQARLLGDSEYGLAISAVVVAIFYVLVAVALRKTQGNKMRLLVESFVALAVAFATVAIPLALDGRWTAVTWSLEGAALIWVGVRQRALLPRLAGGALIFASGIAFVDHGWMRDVDTPLLNGNVLGGLLIAIAALFSARYLAADAHPFRAQRLLSVALLIWGLGWWGTTGVLEALDHGPKDNRLHIITVFIATSVGLLAWIARRYDWLAARRTTLAYLPLLPVLAALYVVDKAHFFVGFGLLAWSIAAIAHFGLLRAYDNGRGRVEGLWHLAGFVFLCALLAFEIAWQMNAAGFSDVWSVSSALLLPVIGAMVILFARHRVAWPLQRYRAAYLAAAGVLIGGQLIGVFSSSIASGGNPAPLPYLPVLNPFDLLTVIGLVVAVKFVLVARVTGGWLAHGRDRLAFVALGLAAFVLTTIGVVRGVHHIGDVPWQQTTLSGSVLVQSALSIYWATIGFGGMILGARRASRPVWLAGTALMALIVIKLFVVDLGGTGTVARIVSFLGVGVLLLVVGYLAPAPPKRPDTDTVAAED